LGLSRLTSVHKKTAVAIARNGGSGRASRAVARLSMITGTSNWSW